MRNHWLFAAGLLSASASLAHLCVIAGGPSWYRFFGAGENMARLAERGSITPAIVTTTIATILAVWAAYAFSGAGVLPPLPLLRTGLVAITAIYLLRAAALPLMIARMPDRGATFLVVSSAIVLAFGTIHAIGLWQGWAQLTMAG